jgi:Tol biopolymer transport system component
MDSLRSNYTLWLMDRDGSNSRQIYPPPGENSAFSRDQYFMAWGPDNQQLAFIFAGNLFIYDRNNETATQVTSDDILARHPVWAPYGAGLDLDEEAINETLRATPLPIPTPTRRLIPGE